MPGQVERKLRLVARIGPEGGVAAIEWTVEEFASVLHYKVLSVRGVAEWPIDVVHQVRLGLGDGGQRILPSCAADGHERQEE